MKNQAKNNIVFSLAQMLTGKKISSDVIYKALELICTTFSFDGGSLYETDYDTGFNLKESFGNGCCQKFDTGKINAKYRTFLSNQIAVYVKQNNLNTDHQNNLLKLFCADSLVLTTITDEKLRICGFIVLSNKKAKAPFSDSDLSLLFVLIDMLNRYAQVRTYHKKLAFARSSLEDILDNTGIDIYVNDFNNHDILYVNKSMAEPYGGQEQFIGNKCWQVLFPGQNGPCEFCPETKLIDENGEPTKIYSWDYQRGSDGEWFRVFSAAFTWVDGRLAHVVSSANITDNKRNEQLVEYMANYDTLTELPNRRKLVADCKERINITKKSIGGYLLFFDIDGFKAINDNHGHDEGDEFLIQLGKFFTDNPVLKDNIYRNGGDEFVALLDTNMTKDGVMDLYEVINNRFKQPWLLKTAKVYCGISIGVAHYPENGETADELLQIADKAMYHIKKRGGQGIAFASDLVEN